MDLVELQELIAIGEHTQFSKYFAQATVAIFIWDYMITLSDEVEYVWKKEKTWAFWFFIVVLFPAFEDLANYRVVLVWLYPGRVSSDDTNNYEVSNIKRKFRCNHTVKWEGYYYVLILTLGLVFLTMRVYAVTEASKPVLVVSGIIFTSSLATGLWFVSAPSAKALQMPKIPLDPFRACVLDAPDKNEWAYRSQIVLADIVAFGCLAVFIFKLKAERGQSRMTRLMRTLFQDSILYFLVTMAFHIVMLLLTFTRGPSVLPPLVMTALIPVMISRLVISLRKTADASLVQVWNGDHFTGAESGVHEMMDFARPLPPSTQSLPFSSRGLRQSSYPDLPDPCPEAQGPRVQPPRYVQSWTS